MQRTKRTKKFILFLVISIATIIFLFPIYWVIITAFKNRGMIYTLPPIFFPAGFTFDNFVEAFQTKPLLLQFFNSLKISVISTAVSILVAALAGFGFSRYKFRGKKAALYTVFIVKMVPGMLLLIPFYMIFQNIGLINTTFSLIISYSAINLPFAIWLIMGFFDEVPGSIFESGLIDGCGELRLFWKLGVPFAVPGMIATGILCFIYSWNEFPIALVLTYTEDVQTLPIAVSGFLDTQVATPMGALAAAGVIAMLPTLILSLTTQRYIVSGLASGAVKG